MTDVDRIELVADIVVDMLLRVAVWGVGGAAALFALAMIGPLIWHLVWFDR